MKDANELLAEYAKTGSEAAFRELVSRYVDLVYSVALRRMNGDPHRAADVVQTVFTDLARKAGRLRAESSLGGWLHRHTCFVTSTLRRSEHRRVAREQLAMEMKQLTEPSDSGWERLTPVLDEAIDELTEADRTAIVLRYYERRDLRAVGLALGTNEDAAQKRVSRALEKLRVSLGARGVGLSAASLGLLLATRAVSAAPVELAGDVGTSALAAAGGTGLLATLTSIMSLLNIKLAIGLTAACLAAGAIVYKSLELRETSAPARVTAKMAGTGPSAVPSAGAPAPAALGQAAAPVVAQDEAPRLDDPLRLTILAADTGQPVPGVQINYRSREKEKFSRKQFISNRSGICDASVPRTTITEIELTSVAEGFADTRLEWRPDRGEVIPAAYTLRLIRPVRIAGRVVDADGQPIVGAKVGWNHQEDGSLETRPESHAFGWIQVETDDDGRWQINRIAGDMLRRLYGSPEHPDHVSPGLLMVSENREAEQQLRDGTHLFRMGRALSVSGTVYDPEGKPVGDASVHAGGVGESGRRESRSAPDGTFSVAGCRSGKNLITAEADGFTAATLELDVSTNTPPVSIRLQRGKTLRLRVADKAGQPIVGANVWYNTFGNRQVSLDKPPGPPAVQVEFSSKTDAEGRAVWDSAPDGELTFSFHKTGYMRQDDVKVDADGQEHVITLLPALIVSGTLSDAETGRPLPKFRIACGWPSVDIEGKIEPRFSGIDRFWLSFAEGKFRHAFEEWIVGGMKSNPGYILKFEAEGYAPLISRVIKEDEGEATLDVKLTRAADLLVTVQLPDGRPAADVEVGLIAPGRDVRLTPGGFSRWNSQNTGGLFQTDAQGQVKLPPDDQVQLVIVAGAAGFAQSTLPELRAEPKLQLQAWGRIEGAYASGRRAADREMSLGPLKVGAVGLQFDFTAYRVTTDVDGRFVFPQVPPGTWKLVRLMPEKQRSGGTVWSHMPVQDVDVRPGETTTLTLGAGTRSVAGRIQFPTGFDRAAGVRVFASIHTPFPKPPAEVQNDRVALEKWGQSPEIRALAQKARGYPLKESGDGTWTADEVEPGEYVVSLGLMTDPPTPGLQPPMAEIPVTIAEGADVQDLGDLPLPLVQ